MPVEKIRYTDFLRQGTDKLNQVVDLGNQIVVDSANATSTANTALTTANTAQSTADITATQLETIIIESGTSDAEVLAARTDGNTAETFATVGGRLDSVTSQLDRTTDVVGVNIDKFPILTPEANDTGRMQRAIDAFAGKGVLQLGNKSLILSSINLKSNVWLLGANANLTFQAGATGDLLTLNNLDNVFIDGITFDGLDTTVFTNASIEGDRTGLRITNSRRIIIGKCLIKGFSSKGVNVNTTGYNSNHAKAVKFVGTDFENNFDNINFGTRGEYCQLIGVTSIKGRYGITVGSGNVFTVASFFNDNVDGCSLVAGANDSHGGFTGCSFNHNTDYSLKSDGIVNGMSFMGCHFYDGDILLKDSTGVQIEGCHIGSPAIIYLEGGSWNSIKNNFLNPGASIVRGHNGKPDKTEVKDNKASDGSTSDTFDAIDYKVDLSLLTVLTGVTTAQDLTFNTVSRKLFAQDNASIYNPTTGVISFPIARTISLSGMLNLKNNVATNTRVEFYILKNPGNIVVYDNVAQLLPSENNRYIPINFVDKVKVGDTYTLKLSSDNGVNTLASGSKLSVQSI